MQAGATWCNLVQLGATWCNNVHLVYPISGLKQIYLTVSFRQNSDIKIILSANNEMLHKLLICAIFYLFASYS